MTSLLSTSASCTASSWSHVFKNFSYQFSAASAHKCRHKYTLPWQWQRMLPLLASRLSNNSTAFVASSHMPPMYEGATCVLNRCQSPGSPRLLYIACCVRAVSFLAPVVLVLELGLGSPRLMLQNALMGYCGWDTDGLPMDY